MALPRAQTIAACRSSVSNNYRITIMLIAPRLESWNLRSGISSPKPTGCCLGELEADLKTAVQSRNRKLTVIFLWFDACVVEG